MTREQAIVAASDVGFRAGRRLGLVWGALFGMLAAYLLIG